MAPPADPATPPLPTWLSAHPAGTAVSVLARPRSSRTRVAGPHGNALAINLAAPPVDGAANDALVAFLAQTLGIARTRVVLRSGESGRRKTVVLHGVSPQQALAALGG